MLYNQVKEGSIMKEKDEQNYFIEFLRFVFSIAILIYHSWLFIGIYGEGIFRRGYLGVDFYFIVTGYLMINSLNRDKKKSKSILKESFDFVFKKYKNCSPSVYKKIKFLAK